MLNIKNLNKTYPNGTQALNEVTLTLDKGMFGLLGPNGAGKSTLMRTIATLQLADTGSIEFDGIDVFKNPEELRKVLGYLPQDFGVYPKVSAEMMLNHIAKVKGITNKTERKGICSRSVEQSELYTNLEVVTSGISQEGCANVLGLPRR